MAMTSSSETGLALGASARALHLGHDTTPPEASGVNQCPFAHFTGPAMIDGLANQASRSRSDAVTEKKANVSYHFAEVSQQPQTVGVAVMDCGGLVDNTFSRRKRT